MDPVVIILLLWCCAILIQTYYWILPEAKERQLSSPLSGVNTDIRPGVSIVICVDRDAQKLDRLLTALFMQSYPHYEIVVVNDGPNREIGEYLSGVSNRHLRILEFESSVKTLPGKKAPLTAGIHAAKFDWLLLTDGDCVPGPEWINAMMKQVLPGMEMVLGVAPFFAKPGFLNLVQRFDGVITAIQYIGAALHRRPYMGVGRNLLYHRSLFARAEGFKSHAHLASGDDDLFVQSIAHGKNTTVSMDKKSFVYSEAPATWTAWLHQKRRHLSTGKVYTTRAKMRTSIFAISWFLLWVALPFGFNHGFIWVASGILVVVVMWLLFGIVAQRLEQHRLIPWYLLLAVSYCAMLIVFAVLLTLRAPRVWMRS